MDDMPAGCWVATARLLWIRSVTCTNQPLRVRIQDRRRRDASWGPTVSGMGRGRNNSRS